MKGSCWTRPICDLHHLRSRSSRFFLPIDIVPLRATGVRGSSGLCLSFSFFLSAFLSLMALGGSLYLFSRSRSYHRSSKPTMVLFPEPDAPTMAVIFPRSNRRLRLSKTFTCGLLG